MPTSNPTSMPSYPTMSPTSYPTSMPTSNPTSGPSMSPTLNTSFRPSVIMINNLYNSSMKSHTTNHSMSPTVNPSFRPSVIINNKSFINPSTNVKIDNYVYIIISVVGFSIILGALYVFIGPIWLFQVARVVPSRAGCSMK